MEARVAPAEGAHPRRGRTAAHRTDFLKRLEDGPMDKRKTWREQEQQLVERWNAATERYRDAKAALSSQSAAKGDGAPTEECMLEAEAARAEYEAVRKQVARMKAEFSAGKRY